MKKMNDGFTLERPRVIHTKPVPQNEVHNLEDFINKALLPYGSFSKIRFSLQRIDNSNLVLTLDSILYQLQPNPAQPCELSFSSATFGESETKTTYTYQDNGTKTKTVLTNSVVVDTSAVGGIPSLKAIIYGIR